MWTGEVKYGMDVNVLLFPDFETLDAFGPVAVLGRIEEYRMCYISFAGGRIVSRQGAAIETAPLVNADAAEVLLVPGGQGTRRLVEDQAFLGELHAISMQSKYCLSVCTGSALLAKTDLLDGRWATSNKKALDWVKSMGPAVRWVDRARWVVDGKFYTSSGVSAGIDMALGFVADRFGKLRAEQISREIEYVWNSDKDDDPFS